MLFEDLEFITLKESDIPVLTPIMKRAFDEDSRMHFDKPEGGPDGYDDGSFLKKWGLESGANAYRVNYNGQAIGAIILFINPKKHEGFLGNIFVDSSIEGKGYGAKMWSFVEHTYPDIRAWYTETPAVSYRNHCFYINKLGFQVYEVEGGRDERFDAQFKLRKLLK